MGKKEKGRRTGRVSGVGDDEEAVKTENGGY